MPRSFQASTGTSRPAILLAFSLGMQMPDAGRAPFWQGPLVISADIDRHEVSRSSRGRAGYLALDGRAASGNGPDGFLARPMPVAAGGQARARPITHDIGPFRLPSMRSTQGTRLNPRRFPGGSGSKRN